MTPADARALVDKYRTTWVTAELRAAVLALVEENERLRAEMRQWRADERERREREN